ncbi:MAG TPA: hypothetical protein VD811_15500 [Desulfuromonadales bacterium]|nr:hypothetical protein [Desulfuromonadales bacterium]
MLLSIVTVGGSLKSDNLDKQYGRADFLRHGGSNALPWGKNGLLMGEYLPAKDSSEEPAGRLRMQHILYLI